MNDVRAYLRIVRRRYRAARPSLSMRRAVLRAFDDATVELLCGLFVGHDFPWVNDQRVGPCAYCQAPIRGAA